MAKTTAMFGDRGVKVAGRRWHLDRYRRDVFTGRRWFTGWVTATGGETSGNRRCGIEVCGPRHGVALFTLDGSRP